MDIYIRILSIRRSRFTLQSFWMSPSLVIRSPTRKDFRCNRWRMGDFVLTTISLDFTIAVSLYLQKAGGLYFGPFTRV